MNDIAASAPQSLPQSLAQSLAQSWKVTLPCTRAEAEALDGELAAFAAMEQPPVLMTSEA